MADKTMADKVIRIGGASAHWLDSATAVPQLLKARPDYLMLDYLSEGAMSVFARMLQMSPDLGYAPDVATVHIGPHLHEIMAQGVKVLANAGGLNPEACAAALMKAGEAAGVTPRIAIVKGDDLRDRADEFRAAGVRDMFHGTPLPDAPLLSLNAYLGAFPIAAALAQGADIVITGRVADSSLALAPLIHEFGWGEGDHDLLAAGTLAGHLLECGCHSTGGTFTDWQEVADGWENMGFPIAECRADGSFVLTKPDGTGGKVSLGTVGEQLLYEVSDPQAYMVADVVCDFSGVKIEEIGRDRVRLTGAKGYAPTGTYKVLATYDAGWRSLLASPIVGFDAAAKAERQGAALIARTRRMLAERNLPDFTRTRVDAVGSEASLGERRRAGGVREVVLRIVVDHPDREGAELFTREQHAAMTAMSVGTTAPMNFVTQPLAAVSSFLLDRAAVPMAVVFEGRTSPQPMPAAGGYVAADTVRPASAPMPADLGEAPGTVQLIRLAWARSGDKGGLFNVGVIARRPDYLPYIAAALTEDAVRAWFAHTFDDPAAGRVERYALPGFDALNFVVPDSLGGSIMASNRLDPVAKTMAQQLLAIPVKVPARLGAELGGAADDDADVDAGLPQLLPA